MISTGTVQVMRRYTGRGPTKAKTVINEDVVTVVLADSLTQGERTLVDAGHSERVLQIRQDIQQAMRGDLVAIVEQELGREVLAFMSQNHIDPDLAVETFVLQPDKSHTSQTGDGTLRRRADSRGESHHTGGGEAEDEEDGAA
jgi:uncharacterized protein YbcI